RRPRRTSSTSRCTTTNSSPLSLSDLRRRPTKLAGTTTLSNLPFAVRCLNALRTSLILPSSSPATTVTRPSSPRLTSSIGRITVSTQHSVCLGNPLGTPTGKTGLLQATGPPALHHLPTLPLSHLWD
ncbi:hypothetical protein C0993_010458, partial [Termitomyces sp. T159_Od127]